KKGGESVRASRGPEFYSQIGHKGGQKVRELIEQGKRLARESSRREEGLDEMGNLKGGRGEEEPEEPVPCPFPFRFPGHVPVPELEAERERFFCAQTASVPTWAGEEGCAHPAHRPGPSAAAACPAGGRDARERRDRRLPDRHVLRDRL